MKYSGRKNTGDDNNNYRWLTTFNDMVTLLMVFFVMLFALSSLDTTRFHNFQNALQSAMGVLDSGQKSPIGVITQADNLPTTHPNVEGLNSDESSKLEDLNRTEGLEAEYTKKGIQLILNDKLLFKTGSASLTQQGDVLLDKVAAIVGPLDRFVRVEGHTDNVPISTTRYPSNWELSVDRAISVVKYLNRKGGIPANSISAAGYGASRPRVANDTKENRSKNRRVEIILQRKLHNK